MQLLSLFYKIELGETPGGLSVTMDLISCSLRGLENTFWLSHRYRPSRLWQKIHIDAFPLTSNDNIAHGDWSGFQGPNVNNGS